jgi:hypothetical protein
MAVIKWYDGKIWRDFSVPGQEGNLGRVISCGDKTLLYVGTDKSRKKLLCWSKEKGGEWRGPTELVSEQTKISQIAGPRYAPESFAPVAYMCLAQEEEGKEKGLTIGKKDETPGWKYWGEAPEKLVEAYPSKYWVHEPWIKVLNVPAKTADGN